MQNAVTATATPNKSELSFPRSAKEAIFSGDKNTQSEKATIAAGSKSEINPASSFAAERKSCECITKQKYNESKEKAARNQRFSFLVQSDNR